MNVEGITGLTGKEGLELMNLIGSKDDGEISRILEKIIGEDVSADYGRILFDTGHDRFYCRSLGIDYGRMNEQDMARLKVYSFFESRGARDLEMRSVNV